MALRPWSPIPIRDGGEPLVPLPPALFRLVPHPYASLGAPYGKDVCPFRLREGVVERLLSAQEHLQRQDPSWRLAIFDAWRPVAVQRFMVAHATAEACRAQGLDPQGTGPAWDAVRQEVGVFWAPPSEDPATPPPIARVPLSISPWPAPSEIPWRWAEPSMRSARSPIRSTTPMRPRPTPLDRRPCGIAGDACWPKRWRGRDLPNIPRSGGISAMAISFGPGGQVKSWPFTGARATEPRLGEVG